MSAARRVTVVGGGLAGITAALDCAAAGAAVSLLEVRPRLGGAAYSFQRDGLTVDNGQHVFLRCCTAYRGLLARLGVEDRVSLQARLDIAVLAPGGRVGRLRRGRLPAPLHLAGALARYPHLGAAQRARAARAALALRRLDPDDPALDRRTFGDWLAEHGQGPAAIEALWDLIALPTLNLPAAEASLGLAVKVFRTGLLDEAGAGDIGHARVPLSDLHDEPARRALAAAGVDVRLHTRVRQVTPAAGGGLEVRGADGDATADAVILAVPSDRAGAVLPEGALRDRNAPARLGTSPIVNVHVVYDRPVCGLPLAAGVGTPVQWVFDRTHSAGVERGQYLAISLSGAEREMDQRPDDLRPTYLQALELLFPAARGAQVKRCFTTREHAATFRQAPGTRALRPGPQTAVPGLLVAGAWTDTGWPATMESAVRSGHAAAAAALQGAALEASRATARAPA